MSYYLAPIANEQQVDANGSPVSGGRIWTYIAGTTTPATTYTDDTGGTAQANPIILNSLGVPASPVWLQGGRTYKFVFQDANGVQTRPTIDDVSGINDPAIASTTDQWVLYANAPTYINATSFSVAGDQTAEFQQYRRLRSINTGGTITGTILSSSYGGGVTTVRVVNDSGALDSGLSQVSLGLLTPNSAAAPTNIAAYRNVIINGGMAVDQRNSGAAQTFTAGAALAYCVDRWYGYCTGANVTGQRVAGSGSTQYRYQFTGAASVTGIGFAQRIEAADAHPLAGKTATLSVDLANSLLTTVTWTAYYTNTADAFGTLASPTRTQIATGSFTVSSTLTRYAVAVNVPAAATTGIEIVFSVGAQTSGTWTIGNVQFKEGGESPFEVRPYQVEESLCRRHFQNISGVFAGLASSATAGEIVVPLTPPMRATPTMTNGGNGTYVDGTTAAAITGASLSNGYLSTARVGITATGMTASRPIIVVGQTLLFSAEL